MKNYKKLHLLLNGHQKKILFSFLISYFCFYKCKLKRIYTIS